MGSQRHELGIHRESNYTATTNDRRTVYIFDSKEMWEASYNNEYYQLRAHCFPWIVVERKAVTEEKKKPVSISVGENSFELVLRILGNEFIAIKLGSTNFSGKLIFGGVLLMFFTFMMLEVFGLSQVVGLE